MDVTVLKEPQKIISLAVGSVCIGLVGAWCLGYLESNSQETNRREHPITPVFDGVKVTDMLLGVAIGDAFGAGIEFASRVWIKENVDFTRYLNLRWKQSWGWSVGYSAGMYTDDTEMTVGLVCRFFFFPRVVRYQKTLVDQHEPLICKFRPKLTSSLHWIDYKIKCLIQHDPITMGPITTDVMLSYWKEEYDQFKTSRWGLLGRNGHGCIRYVFISLLTCSYCHG
eukprot:TRINITY_DN8465_c0_g1_i41.p1 TRINITY_DN8465_c0_g1~~TRINITY_DN8465_c0_g1_i41.p1  ORF type:complete len:225 (+),score=24.57 TRINITY_DN8465_c0_g1_i41:663-1337(+)